MIIDHGKQIRNMFESLGEDIDEKIKSDTYKFRLWERDPAPPTDIYKLKVRSAPDRPRRSVWVAELSDPDTGFSFHQTTGGSPTEALAQFVADMIDGELYN